MTLAEQMMEVFKDTPHPGHAFEDISKTPQDEGIVDYFSGKTWQGHSVKDLHDHDVALTFFTPRAFRYYLPAFLLADLSPEGEGIFSDFIAHAFTLRDELTLGIYLAEFSIPELEAICQYFRYWQEKSIRSNDDWAFDTFTIAEDIITNHLTTISQ